MRYIKKRFRKKRKEKAILGFYQKEKKNLK